MGQAMAQTTQVQWLLAEWARWRKIESGEAKGYPSQTPFRRLLGSSLPSAAIDTEQAERVDRAVCRLMSRCEDQGTVLVLYYLEGMPLYRVRARINESYETTARLLASAETAIDYIMHPEHC